MKMLRKSLGNLSKSDRRMFAFLFVAALVGAFLFFWTFNYIDGQTITAWSVNNWDLLVEGRWGDFYVDKAMNTRGASELHLDMGEEGLISPFMYLLQSIWCFPLWVTHYFNGNMNVGTIGCVYWYKTLLFAAIVVMAYFCYRIVKRISGSDYNAVLAALLILGSSEIMLSAGYSGQDEVIYLCTMMISMDFLLRDKWKIFILLSIYVVTLCPMMIVWIFPILLLKQKNVLRVIADAAIMFVPTVLWAVLSAGMEYKSTSRTLDDQLSRTVNYIQIPVISGRASLMVIVFVLLCFLTYFIKPDVSDKRVIWLSSILAIYMSFFNDNLFYRSLLYVPFAAILVMSDVGGGLDFKLLLMTMLNYLRFFLLGIDSPMHMNTRYTQMNKAVVAMCQAAGSDKYLQSDPLVMKIIEKIPILHDMGTAFNGVCVAIIILILWITYQDKNEEAVRNYRIINKNSVIVIYGLCVPIYIMLFYAVILY